MLVAYRCDSLSINDLKALMGYENTGISSFMQRAVYAHVKSVDLNKAKDYTGSVKTLRLVHFFGADEDEIRSMEFTAMIQDQTFNVVHMVSDKDAAELCAIYVEMYKDEVSQILEKLETELFAAIDSSDSCLTINAVAATGSLTFQSNSMRQSDFLRDIAKINDRARERMSQKLSVSVGQK